MDGRQFRDEQVGFPYCGQKAKGILGKDFLMAAGWQKGILGKDFLMTAGWQKGILGKENCRWLKGYILLIPVCWKKCGGWM